MSDPRSAFNWQTFEQPFVPKQAHSNSGQIIHGKWEMVEGGERETAPLRGKPGPKAKVLRDNTGHPLCTPIANQADADKQARIKGRV